MAAKPEAGVKSIKFSKWLIPIDYLKHCDTCKLDHVILWYLYFI